MAHFILSYSDLKQHPKVARLSKLLAISKVTAIGHLHYLWWWCMSYAPDGDLSKFTADEIADGCGWEGDADELRDALWQSRFVDVSEEDDTVTIHDWDQYGGKLIAKRKADLERKSKGTPRISHETGNGTPSELRWNSIGIPAEFHRHSDVEQNRTEQNREETRAGARGLSSSCLAFKARYPPTNNKTDDETLGRVWYVTIKSLADEARVRTELEAWKSSDQWNNPTYIPSMESFLTKSKYRTLPRAHSNGGIGAAPAPIDMKKEDPSITYIKQSEKNGRTFGKPQ